MPVNMAYPFSLSPKKGPRRLFTDRVKSVLYIKGGYTYKYTGPSRLKHERFLIASLNSVKKSFLRLPPIFTGL